jgi:ABC-2 type transport system permease protein
MKRIVSIYRTFVTQYLKRLVNYRVDFIIGVLSFMFVQLSGVLLITLVFNQITDLNGYSFEQMIFFYGFFQLPRGIDHLFTDNIWLIPMKIRKADMDRYLLRPISPLFQIVAERFQHEAFGEIITGILLITITYPALGIELSLFRFLVLILLIFLGAGIYTSVKLLTASTAFWTMNSLQLMVTIYNISDFAKYPISIFPSYIQILITYVIPFAFVSFFPASFLLNQIDATQVLLGSGLAFILIAWMASSLWRFGIQNYQSSGS